MTHDNYVSRKLRLLKGLDKSVARVKRVLTSRYGQGQAKTFIKDSRQEYESLIPQISYIGEKNPSLIFLLPTIRCLAVYRAFQRQGKTVEDAWQLIYEMSEAELNAIPRFVRRTFGHFWFSRLFLIRLKRRAKRSQERGYPDDFVMNFIEGDRQSFDYEIGYTEYANVKFLKAPGALELAPYICATDKVASEMLG